MHFSSDNASGVAPEIMAALAEANEGPAWAYGNDAITQRLVGVFSQVFERDVSVYPVATGTAANSLILATLTMPWDAVLCCRTSHINLDEGGAPEMFTSGAKLVPIEGVDGKVTADGLEETLARMPFRGVHHADPTVLSLTQSTELGTVYSLAEIEALCTIAKREGLRVHMDGARFANALAALGCSPAEATWKLGVDALSFGATKNGAMAAEAAIFFDRGQAATFERRRKRAGHLFSKQRFLAAQLEAYVADGLWLRLARHANAMAADLAAAIEATEGVALAGPVEANEVFAVFRDTGALGQLRESGVDFIPWDAARGVIRLVASFQTTEAEVRQFRRVLGDIAGSAA